MQLSLIITQLRTYCPSFSSRVGGAADFDVVPDVTALSLPCAYVVPLDDNPGPMESQTGYRQKLRDGFAVILRVSNTADERGQAAVDAVRVLRAEVWAALLAWQPTADYGAIEYEGGNLLQMNRAVLDYQLEFSAPMEIDANDTWIAARDSAADQFIGATIQVDAIDPFADPNVQQPGPDDRIEATVDVGVDPLRALSVSVNPASSAYALRLVELVAGEPLVITVAAWTAVAGFNDAIQFINPDVSATLSLSAVIAGAPVVTETANVALTAGTDHSFYSASWEAITAKQVVLTITSDTDVVLGIILQGGTPVP